MLCKVVVSYREVKSMNNNLILSRFFTHNTLLDFIESGNNVSLLNSIVIRYGIRHDADTTNQEIISEIYHYVDKNYRNEYYYKNTLLNKLIIGAHRLNTTTALTEVPIAKSKADFIMINGKAVVYEIKTELDSFERLNNQIVDYYKAFDHVCVVTSESQLTSLQSFLPSDSPVGIYIVTSKGTIRRIKEPETYSESISKEQIFKILNKPEYESIIQSVYHSLPKVTPINYYQICKEKVCDIPAVELYPLFLKELKRRNRIELIDFSKVPFSLRFLAYFSKCNKSQYQKLMDNLNDYYEEE